MAAGERFADEPELSLGARTARGSVITAAFLAAINVLGLVKIVAAAGFLGASEYGVWGLIAVTTGFILALGAVGVDDKYIQQDHPDQRAAFQIAFTLQCGLALLLAAAIVVAMPLFALAYDQPDVVAPGMALAVALPAAALGTPLWIFWRRMDFLQQRRLQIWDPVVSLVVVVGLAAAGLGVWALVIGTTAGAYAAAFAAWRASPYPLRLRYEPGALREYASFSWPLFVAAVSAVLVALIPSLVASNELGLAAVGAIALATTIAQFVYRVDEVLTQVIYPAICAVRDRVDLLYAAFSRSNRLALLWALPCGAGGALFAGDFVEHVLGEDWRFAVTLVQVLAVTAAINQIGFNWTAFYRALGRTRPIAAGNLVFLAAVCAIAVPLLLAEGVDGYAAGMAVATGVFLAVRLALLARLFPIGRMLVEMAPAFVPALAATGVVLALRVAPGDGRPVWRVVAELVVFGAMTVALTALTQRELMREVLGYLREGGISWRPRRTAASPTTAVRAGPGEPPPGESPG